MNSGSQRNAPQLGDGRHDVLQLRGALSFDNVGYATDLEIQGDEPWWCLENRVVKVDLSTGQMLADVELLGAQEATLLDDGTVVVTRGGLDDAWQPLDLTSFLVWLDADDLGLEGELLPTEGPTLPSQEVTVVNGKVYVAVNNGWNYTAKRSVDWDAGMRKKTSTANGTW